jgi:hypothetical protein
MYSIYHVSAGILCSLGGCARLTVSFVQPMHSGGSSLFSKKSTSEVRMSDAKSVIDQLLSSR